MSVQQSGVNERLAALTAAGTSVWLDQIRRNLIESGELERLVREDSLRGVTSNPSIFEKAILGSDDYDDDIKAGAEEGLSAKEIYESIAVKDVQLARGRAAPGLGRERTGTTGSSRSRSHPTSRSTLRRHAAGGARLLGPGRPPEPDDQDPGHRRGLGGDRGGDRRGHQHQRHAAVLGRVVRARHRALHPRDGAAARRRRVDGRPLGRELLRLARGHRGRQAARGGRATPTSRARPPSPTRARRTRSSRRSSRATASRSCATRAARCSARCGRRPGVKNPHYSDTKYVDELVAPHTVNTMPMPTLLAAAERAEISGATADQDPSDDLAKLEAAGIDMQDVTKKLLTRWHRRVRQVRSTR